MYKENISFSERIIAALSYISAGFVGFIWLLIAFFMKKNLTVFLRYHVFQAIFLSIFYYIISALLGLVMQIFNVIPIVNQIAVRIFYMLNMPIFYGFSVINTIIYIILFYLALTSIQGKFSYLPWVSDIIKENIGR